jgi:hypothetical protein
MALGWKWFTYIGDGTMRKLTPKELAVGGGATSARQGISRIPKGVPEDAR